MEYLDLYSKINTLHDLNLKLDIENGYIRSLKKNSLCRKTKVWLSIQTKHSDKNKDIQSACSQKPSPG